MVHLDLDQRFKDYEYGARLRTLCFEAVGRFELTFRNIVSEVLSSRHGNHPYDAPAIFKNANAWDWARHRAIEIYQKSWDERAHHYRDTYNAPAMPPVWMFK